MPRPKPDRLKDRKRARHPSKSNGNHRAIAREKQFCEDMCSKVEEMGQKRGVQKTFQMQDRADELAKNLSASTNNRHDGRPNLAVIVRLVGTCTNCGKLFPHEEHESLCRDCR